MDLAAIIQSVVAHTPVDGLIDRILQVVFTLASGAAIWTARTVFYLRDRVKSIDTKLGSIKEGEGVVYDVHQLTGRVSSIETRNTKMDVLAQQYEEERELFKGPDRRRFGRLMQRLLQDEPAQD